jgi:hypothetical protein
LVAVLLSNRVQPGEADRAILADIKVAHASWAEQEFVARRGEEIDVVPDNVELDGPSSLAGVDEEQCPGSSGDLADSLEVGPVSGARMDGTDSDEPGAAVGCPFKLLGGDTFFLR